MQVRTGWFTTPGCRSTRRGRSRGRPRSALLADEYGAGRRCQGLEHVRDVAAVAHVVADVEFDGLVDRSRRGASGGQDDVLGGSGKVRVGPAGSAGLGAEPADVAPRLRRAGCEQRGRVIRSLRAGGALLAGSQDVEAERGGVTSRLNGTPSASLSAHTVSADARGVVPLRGVATGAADGYGRMTGGPAATLPHLGPGPANGLANLHNARRANTRS